MTATQPAPSTPPAQPTPGSPWTPDPAPISQPTRPRYTACCDLAAGGDFCDCAALTAEVIAAFRRPAPWGPIVLDLRAVAL